MAWVLKLAGTWVFCATNWLNKLTKLFMQSLSTLAAAGGAGGGTDDTVVLKPGALFMTDELTLSTIGT